MNYFNDPNFMRQVIMEHNEHPKNKHSGSDYYESKRMNIDSCIDDITIYLKRTDELIEDICFEGQACTISTSSASIMTELLKGKSIEEAKKIMDNFYAMIDLEDYDADILGEAAVFQNVGKQPNRIKCATLSWRGVQALLESEEENA